MLHTDIVITALFKIEIFFHLLKIMETNQYPFLNTKPKKFTIKVLTAIALKGKKET